MTNAKITGLLCGFNMGDFMSIFYTWSSALISLMAVIAGCLKDFELLALCSVITVMLLVCSEITDLKDAINAKGKRQ